MVASQHMRTATYRLHEIAKRVELLAEDFAAPAGSHHEAERRVEQVEQVASDLRAVVR